MTSKFLGKLGIGFICAFVFIPILVLAPVGPMPLFIIIILGGSSLFMALIGILLMVLGFSKMFITQDGIKMPLIKKTIEIGSITKIIINYEQFSTYPEIRIEYKMYNSRNEIVNLSHQFEYTIERVKKLESYCDSSIIQYNNIINLDSITLPDKLGIDPSDIFSALEYRNKVFLALNNGKIKKVSKRKLNMKTLK